MFSFTIATGGEWGQVDQVLHGAAIEWNFAGDVSVDTTGCSGPVINHVGQTTHEADLVLPNFEGAHTVSIKPFVSANRLPEPSWPVPHQ